MWGWKSEIKVFTCATPWEAFWWSGFLENGKTSFVTYSVDTSWFLAKPGNATRLGWGLRALVEGTGHIIGKLSLSTLPPLLGTEQLKPPRWGVTGNRCGNHFNSSRNTKHSVISLHNWDLRDWRFWIWLKVCLQWHAHWQSRRPLLLVMGFPQNLGWTVFWGKISSSYFIYSLVF